MSLPHADALVFFGATGDLAYKKIFPALQAMVRSGRLNVPVVGVARSKWSLDHLRARARESLEKAGDFDPVAYEGFASLLRFVGGDYDDPSTYARLRVALGDAKRPLHYLAIPTSLFATVVEGLADAGCAKGARIVVEKPFGRDLSSARALNATLHRVFPERAIFRIDHYLAKEAVQNLLYFRFANPNVEAVWSNNFIDAVQITNAEAFGVEGRGTFYEEVGAIRDVVQNHMLHLVASLCMECPRAGDNASLRTERTRLLHQVRALDPTNVVRGQYLGYRSEPGVSPDSRVETFAAVRLQIDSSRWSGVPIFVRIGKRLPVTVTEVRVQLKRPLRPILDEPASPIDDYFRFQISPSFVIALGTKVKKPGELMVGERLELVACQRSHEDSNPYVRLLSDALKGDPTLFASEEAIEESWRIVDPIIGDATPLHDYAPGTWGPPEAARLLSPDGGWVDPKPERCPP